MRPSGDSPSASSPHPEPHTHFAVPGAVEVIAHRGFSAVAPENTIVALERALDAGADALEFDLQVSADGKPVLLHDATLERTTNGWGPVHRIPWAALQQLDAGAWFDGAFRGEPLPLLERALEAVRGRAARIYPELKDVRGPADVDRMVDAVEKVGFLGTTVFISIEWDLLTRIRRRAPEAAIGYVVTEADLAEAAIARAAGDPRALVDFDRRIPLEDPAVPAAARAAGVEMAAWTVDDTAEAARLLDLGIPRITTNQVARMVAWKAGLEPR